MFPGNDAVGEIYHGVNDAVGQIYHGVKNTFCLTWFLQLGTRGRVPKPDVQGYQKADKCKYF